MRRVRHRTAAGAATRELRTNTEAHICIERINDIGGPPQGSASRSTKAARSSGSQKTRFTSTSYVSVWRSSDEAGTFWDTLVRTRPDKSGRATPRGEIIEDSHEAARERLVSELNALRKAAGNPSIGHLVKLSQRKLSKSTLHDHLSNRRTKLPPWRLVSAYISACREAADATGLDTARLGTVDEWYAIYKASVEGRPWTVSPLKAPKDTMFFDTSSLAVPEPPDDLEPSEAPVQLESPKPSEVPEPPEASEPPEDPEETLRVDYPQYHMRPRPKPVTQSDAWRYADSSIGPVIRKLENELPHTLKSLTTYMGILIVTGGSAIGSRFQLESNITTIGRSPESDIWLNDLSVSRSHAVIRKYGDRFFVDDSDSTNGTYKDNLHVDRETPLQSWEELHIGIYSLLFVQGDTHSSHGLPRTFNAIRSRLASGLARSTGPLMDAGALRELSQPPTRREQRPSSPRP